MRDGRFFRCVSLIILVFFTASCASTQVPPISSSGSAFRPESDEQRLWGEARAEEARLRNKASLYRDPALERYLEGVLFGLNPPGMAANRYISFRITVIEDPTLNAFAFPHGSLYVHTGLLARMENEDQLASVLGHEMTHVEGRHLLRQQRSLRNKQIGYSVAAIAGSLIIASVEDDARDEGKYGKASRIAFTSDLLLGLGLNLAIIASVNGYGRDLEREADGGGFAKMAASGYDVREAPKVYRALMEEQGDSGKAEVFFFGSHPRLQSRIDAAEEWAAAHPDLVRVSKFQDQDGFRRRMRPVILRDAALNLKVGRLELAESQLDRVLAQTPRDARAYELLGEVKLGQA
ncbi:MAG: M48 family metalloprotease, partial [Acidobacteriota bacterium]